MARPTQELVTARIDSLTHDGRGVARPEGKTVFIEGGLPGEEVRFRYLRHRGRFDEGKVAEVLSPSSQRTRPLCPHFGACGGCSLQHLDWSAQLGMKQQVLLEQLRHVGRVEPDEVLPPLTGPLWGYRRRARLGVKYVAKKGRVLVGFREKSSAFITDLSHCATLHPAVGSRLPVLAALIASLDASRHIPQVEVAVGDEAAALVFRHLHPLGPSDLDKLRGFGEMHGLGVLLQSGGLDTVAPLWPPAMSLSYRLPESDAELFFQPTDFVQVNAEVNRKMVVRAIELLDPGPQERVLDLFCGIGNFTLPLARRAAYVLGVEGDARLTERARANAVHNRLSNVEFVACDLASLDWQPVTSSWRFHKVLLDPPRTGAQEVVSQLTRVGAERVLYISCNPATLARDAGVLVHEQGYRLARAGIIDMFPHTAHVEAIALFAAAATKSP